MNLEWGSNDHEITAYRTSDTTLTAPPADHALLDIGYILADASEDPAKGELLQVIGLVDGYAIDGGIDWPWFWRRKATKIMLPVVHVNPRWAGTNGNARGPKWRIISTPLAGRPVEGDPSASDFEVGP